MDVITLLLACLAAGAQPTSERCNTRLVIETSHVDYTEKFTLSLNDPIEFFRYQSRYQPWGETGPFLLLPVLGDIRDRFITDDPFSDTLLFTSMIGGGGFHERVGPVSLFADTGLIYLKQRYASNFVHTDVAREPELNELYGFAQFAGASNFGVGVAYPRWSLNGVYGRIDLKSKGEVYAAEEGGIEAKGVVWRGESQAYGIYGQWYRRVSGLRRDHGEDGIYIGRLGIYGEF